MMARSHLAVNGAITAAGLSWLSVLRDPTSAAAIAADTWIRDVVSWPTLIVGQGVPAWIGDRPAREAAQWLWTWLFPLWDGNPVGSGVYAVLAAVLLIGGTLFPDADSKSSAFGRMLPFAKLGPHRGLLHTDWFLLTLFAASVAPQTRALVWLWLGAWLHCELDGLSKLGRVRFYPLTNHRLTLLPGGQVSVKRAGRYLALYEVGSLGETALLGGFVAVAGIAIYIAFSV